MTNNDTATDTFYNATWTETRYSHTNCGHPATARFRATCRYEAACKSAAEAQARKAAAAKLPRPAYGPIVIREMNEA